MEGRSERKRVRDHSDNSEHDSPEVKKLRYDLIDFLDETDAACPSTQDLDSVLKSLEDEISAPLIDSPAPSNIPVVDLTSESGESQHNLGYLLEASDDELGLPPSFINSREEESKPEETELIRVPSDSSGIGELWSLELENQVPNYDSFDLAMAVNSDYVPYDDGLFGYSDVYFDSFQCSDFSWRFDTLPAQ